MRILSTIILLTIWISANSQTEICEEYSFGYSKCYVLDSTGHFKYAFDHCTGSNIGAGTFKKTKNSLVFTFDSIVSPRIEKQKVNDKKGVVQICLFDVTGEFPSGFSEVSYNKKSFLTDSLGIVEIEYSGGPIVIYQYFKKDSLVLYPDKDDCNKYVVFWHFPGDTFVKSGTKQKLIKVGDKYKFKEQVLHFDEGKEAHIPKSRTTYYVITGK